MIQLEKMLNMQNDPQALEELYQRVKDSAERDAFNQAITASYQTAPDNILLAAWYYRLKSEASAKTDSPRVNWLLAALTGILTGLIFWAISDPDIEILNHIPAFFLTWSPVAAVLAIAFLALASRKGYRQAAWGAALLVIATAYVLLIAPTQGGGFSRPYLDLMAVHFPLLSWIALGTAVLGMRSSIADRFSFLIKSVEVMVAAGVYLIAGVAFGGITMGMFTALGINLPEVLLRLIAAGGFGLIPVLALASMYNPQQSPQNQDFRQGLSRFIATLMRLLIPLSLAVLGIYILVIPFRFLEPYRSREVLIVYNLMLFGIMGLLLGATPIRSADLSLELQNMLRRGIIAVASLAVLVSLYALSATVYRTALGGITINRLTIIGWNTINIGILIWLIIYQYRPNGQAWDEKLRYVFSKSTNAYVAWTIFLIVAIPLLFR